MSNLSWNIRIGRWFFQKLRDPRPQDPRWSFHRVSWKPTGPWIEIFEAPWHRWFR